MIAAPIIDQQNVETDQDDDKANNKQITYKEFNKAGASAGSQNL